MVLQAGFHFANCPLGHDLWKRLDGCLESFINGTSTQMGALCTMHYRVQRDDRDIAINKAYSTNYWTSAENSSNNAWNCNTNNANLNTNNKYNSNYVRPSFAHLNLSSDLRLDIFSSRMRRCVARIFSPLAH